MQNDIVLFSSGRNDDLTWRKVEQILKVSKNFDYSI